MDKRKALEILNKEKDYEEDLVKHLGEYFIDCIQDIPLDDKVKKKLIDNLTIIKTESVKHKYIFGQLIEKVMNDEKDNF